MNKNPMSTASLITLKHSTKGGPLAEYMPLLAFIAFAGMLAVTGLGKKVTEIFDIGTNTLSDTLEPGGSGNPGGGPIIPGSIITSEGGFCPPSGWSYVAGRDYYWVPGVVTQRPVFELFHTVTTEWDPPSDPQPALGAGFMDKMAINSPHEQLHWPDHIHPILVGWHAFTNRYVVPANAIQPPDPSCPEGNRGEGGVGAEGPERPSGGGTLMGTPGDDLLELDGIDREVIGLAGNDTIRGWTSAARNEILDGGPGNDDIRGGEGSDTYIFEPGHGMDFVSDFTGSSDVFFFDNIFSWELEVTRAGNDLLIQTSPGNVVTWAGAVRQTNAINYRIEDMIFEDRTMTGFDVIQIGVTQSVENANANDYVMTTPFDDKWVVRDYTPSININDNLSNDDTLVLPDYNLDEVTFTYAGGGIYQPSVNINLPNGNTVFIRRHAQFGTESVENVIFRDQVVTQSQFRTKYLRDQQNTGFVYGLNSNDTYTWTPGQTPFQVEELSGTDTFDLSSTARSEWTFASNNANYGQESLLMDHSSGARLVVRQPYNSGGRQIENFVFSDQTLTWAQMETIAPR